MTNILKRESKIYTPEEINLMVENSYLGLPLSFDDSKVPNMLMDGKRGDLFNGNPMLEILDVMRNPDYFYYTCKWLLNIDLLPFQLVILQELWRRKFPMLIATRGGGKCVTKETLIQLEDRFIKIGDLIGCNEPVQEKIFFNGIIRNKEKCFGENGYHEIEYGWNNGYGKVKRICTSYGYEINGVPEHKIRVYRDGSIRWISLDELRINDHVLVHRGGVWHNGDNGLIPEFARELGEYTGNSNEEVPDIILGASKQSVYDFIKGFLSCESGNKNPSTWKMIHLLANKLGYVLKLDLGDKYKISTIDNPIVRDIDGSMGYFLDRIVSINDGFDQTFDVHIPSDHSFLSNTFVSHNTWILSLYAMLRAIFTQGSKIIVVGAAFRQSKLLFEYMEQMWRNAPVLRHMVGEGKGQGPKRDIDRCTFYVGDSVVHSIPVGDGCLLKGTKILTKDCFSTIEKPTTNIWGNQKWRYSDEFLDNGEKPIKTITTKRGYSYSATNNHKMKIIRNNEISWVRTDEIELNDYILIDRSYVWHEGKIGCKDYQAYILGLMLDSKGCGWKRNKNIHVECNDSILEICEKMRRGVFVSVLQEKRRSCLTTDIVNEFIDIFDLQDKSDSLDRIPECMWKASREEMTIFLRGFFDSNCRIEYKDKSRHSVRVKMKSEELAYELQYILLHYGIICTKSLFRGSPCLYFYGEDIIKLYKEVGINFIADPISPLINGKVDIISKDDLIPNIIDILIKITKEHRKKRVMRPSDFMCRGSITYNFLTKFLEIYSDVDCEDLDKLREIHKSNIYYDTVSNIKDGIGHTYDMHVPDGHEYCANGFFSHNSKIRGLRANYTIADEFGSIQQEIFEVVIRGFSSVSSAPSKRTKDFAKLNILKMLGLYEREDEEGINHGNQTIISGTAYYTFDHFYEYWKRYRDIIQSRGDQRKLEELLQGEVPKNFDWRNYSIFRIPWYKLPPGFMDESQIHQAKVTVTSAVYQMEYGAVFVGDSDGFFKRSLIESCVCKTPIQLASGPVRFSASTRGNPNLKYIYGIDPASEKDNFSIIVLEVHSDHRRIVYSWSINRQLLKKRLKKRGEHGHQSFYSYCARKIRDLMKIFPTDHIGIDSQGGGIAIMEALKDENECNFLIGEQLVWPYIKQGKDDPFWWEKEGKDTDGEPGLHILHMVQFANNEFKGQSNHGLRKDFETKSIIFPQFDTATISEAISLDKINDREYDTLEDCVMEIEELKDELATIIHDQTTNGIDRWGTPEIKLPGNKKGRLRKDRYSALVIANMIARTIDNKLTGIQHQFVGGFAGQKPKESNDGKMYIGPEHLVSKMNSVSYKCVQR